ncbi:MAG: enoyl-CoA hydratase-related protein [Gammaproteobacteria bacterium]|nr:enoyl-CoA hydratase-related protein [Gammaproteobacteria bacterium]
MTQHIQQSREGLVETVILNRPDKLNAMTKPMWQRLGEVIRALSKDDGLRCIVLRGAGNRAFSPGNDIAEFPTERSNVEQARDYGEVMTGTVRAFRECRHPLVAMIHGICVGGGLEIAVLCDIRICGASSRFGVPIKRLGLVMSYTELGALTDLVGRSTALEMLLEGRVVDAQEAANKGLVNRVVPDAEVEAETRATVQRIVDGAPLVARWHKKFIARLADSTPLSAAERDESYACFGTEDFQIGYRSFLGKTKPDFTGR